MTPPNKDGKKTADRGPAGRFAKGNRASPGRPAGRGKVAELRDKLAQDLDQIIAVLRAQALVHRFRKSFTFQPFGSRSSSIGSERVGHSSRRCL